MVLVSSTDLGWPLPVEMDDGLENRKGAFEAMAILVSGPPVLASYAKLTGRPLSCSFPPVYLGSM